MDPTRSTDPFVSLPLEIQETIREHFSVLDAKTVSAVSNHWEQIASSQQPWRELIKKEFPEVTCSPEEANREKYLKVLNYALFRHLARIDPLNLSYINTDSLDTDDPEPIESYERLNQWAVDLYSKRTLAQLLSLTTEKVRPEHERALRQVMGQMVEGNEKGIVIVHKPEGSLGRDHDKEDELTQLTQAQLDLITSVISAQEGPLNLSLVNVGLQDGQLSNICRLVEEGKIAFLDLSQNGISDTGARELGRSLATETCRVAGVNLDNNNLTELGAEALIFALPETGLFSLELRNNPIPKDLHNQLTKNKGGDFSGVIIEFQ